MSRHPLHVHVLCFVLTLLLLGLTAPPVDSATATSVISPAGDLRLDHVRVVGHVQDIEDMELGDLLAANSEGLGFFAANRPGTNAYDGGWAILDLERLNSGPATAVKHFQAEPVYYQGGGVSASGHFVALRYDARIWAENNRSDVVVYNVADPAAPALYGTFRLEKPPGVFRNLVSDMVVYADRAYLLVNVLMDDPSQNFRGIVVLDLSSPDPSTKELPEIGRHAYPLIDLMLGDHGTMYGSDSEGMIYGLDLTEGLSLRGNCAAGGGFDMDVPYGTDGVIGRRQGQYMTACRS